MQIVKLNCTACGAPISIPEDIDTLFCTSCGSKLAVDRGDGYITLKLVEKITQAIQESSDKARSAINENTYVTKVELKRVQISQSINTEEMKLNSLRQEIRGLTRKPQLLPVEVQQLSSLRLDECNILLRIRKLNMDSAKLEDGWEESMEVFQNDLAALNEIIQNLTPYGADPAISSRLTALNQERLQCEIHLTELETKLLSKQLKYLKYAPLFDLSVEELEKLNIDLQSDINLLVANPQSGVKTRFRAEANKLLSNLNALYPRRKVESVTGELKSLDINQPYPEIPWKLIPLIELAEVDLEKVRLSPDNPSKNLIKNEIEKKVKDMKALQALDLPAQRVLAEKKRKQKSRSTSIILLSLTAIVIIILVILISGSKKGNSSILNSFSNTPNTSNSNTTQTNVQNTYQAVKTDLFEVVAQKTYLRNEPDINSPELDPITHGQLLFNLGPSSTAPDWYQIQSFSGDLSGFLYQQWLSPIHGLSIQGTPENTGKSIIFSDDFSEVTGTWYEDSFDDDFGQGKFAISNGSYQIDLNAIDGGYIYSKIDLNELPPAYNFSLSEKLIKSNASSAAGLITNFTDENNFDYFLLISDGSIVIGCRRNGENYSVYNTQSTPNNAAIVDIKQQNKLSVMVGSLNDGEPNFFTYAVNGKSIYSLEFEKSQKYSPTIGIIVWSMDVNQPVSYSFDDVTVSIIDK